MKIKVLVVEDNAALRQSVLNVLRKERYGAEGAGTAETAREKYTGHRLDIILLDIMLPGGSGLELVRFFKNNGNALIIMLTALDDEASKRMAYENGADDYITKPFDLFELIYKLNAMRRRILLQGNEFEIGDIRFNTETNLLACGGRSFYIQKSQINLLKNLYEAFGRKEYLDKERISGFAKIDESTRVHTLVARLRKNLMDVGSREVTIETIYNKGYQLLLGRQQGEKYE